MRISPSQTMGIDVIGEDKMTIIHHKTSAIVWCIITEQDYDRAKVQFPNLSDVN